MKNRNFKILQIGTKAPGGIFTVIDNYFKDNLLSSSRMNVIYTNKNQLIFLNVLYYILGCFKVLNRVLLNRSNLIIHAHSAMRGSFFRKTLIMFYSRIFGSKVILHIHGSEFKEFYFESNFIIKAYIRYSLNSSDCVVVLSDRWKDFFDSISDAKIRVVNNYIKQPKNINKDIACSDTLRLLFLGEIGPRKGLFDLLNALKIVVDNGHNVILNVGGKGNEKQFFDTVNNLGLKKNVNFHGWVLNDQKESLFNDSDVLILPSYNEGLPMVILEAMSRKLAIISTTVGGIPEVIISNSNGLLIEPGDIQGIVESIEILINPDKLNEFAINGYETYKNRFTAEHVHKEILKIYEEII